MNENRPYVLDPSPYYFFFFEHTIFRSSPSRKGDPPDFSPPARENLLLSMRSLSSWKFLFRVSLKRMHNGAKEKVRKSAPHEWWHGCTSAPTVLGNQVEILSHHREPSGGNHFRKESARRRETARAIRYNNRTGIPLPKLYVCARVCVEYPRDDYLSISRHRKVN